MKYLAYLIFAAFIVSVSVCVKQKDKSNIMQRNHGSIKLDTIHLKDSLLGDDSASVVLSGYNIVNESFEYILDALIKEYDECKRVERGYHFSIAIQNAKVDETSGVKKVYLAEGSIETKSLPDAKSLYISRSYYKDFVSKGYGFIYYKDYLFILEGLQLEDFFSKNSKTQVFKYRNEPVITFDPPRWLYYYYNNKFYIAYSAPCGG